MPPPTFIDQMRYLAGFRAPESHREWLAAHLAMEDKRKLGFRLALPNSFMVLTLAGSSFYFGDTAFGAVLIAGALTIPLIGALVIPVTRRRVKWLAKRNHFEFHEGEAS